MDLTQKRIIEQVNLYKESMLKNEISLTKIFSSNKCQTIISESREFRDRIYTPLKTIFIFIKQVLDPDKSCKNAVAGFVSERKATAEEPISGNTGPYCKARERLPEGSVNELVREVSSAAVELSMEHWKWLGHEIKLVDGTTLLMQDTEKNQNIFPQHKSQKEGVGFPIARLVAIMSLSVGVVMDYAADAYKGKGTGEASLLRKIFNCINTGDIILADRYYPSYFLITDLQVKKANGLFQGQGQRKYDFRKGEFIGKKDHIVDWLKPAKPFWMDTETYNSYPKQIKVREFKVDGRIYVTTLLNHKKYNKNELAKLYKLRWQVETNLKFIKSVMKMDMLSCKSPDMVKKEIGVHFLAYNLIRIMIAEACSKFLFRPNEISFKGTVQLLNKFMPYFLNSKKPLYRELLQEIVKNKIGNRPGRIEPRMVKRRRKPFPLLQEPRRIVKLKLIKARGKATKLWSKE